MPPPPGIVLISDGFDDALVAELHQAMALLPPGLRHLRGGPLELELHDTTAPLGMGDGTPTLPMWSTEHRRFHLYRYAETTERRASLRLKSLTSAEREALWRRRALVHAVMQRLDDELRLSARPAWRRLNVWLRPFERPFTWEERPLNQSTNAYSRALGQQSAALDFITFAEERFVPAESVRPDALPEEDTARCQEFSKHRVLDQLLHEQGLGPPPVDPRCAAFERWADLQAFSHLEVLLVQASGRRPESLFGHLLLRPVHESQQTMRGPGFQTAIQLAALTDPGGGPMHLMRGIFGGYSLQVITLSMRDIEREMLEDEQRSIRRFRLNLTRQQSRAVLERTWELERRSRFDYQFFTDNCGSALLWLLQGALGESVELARHGFAASPGGIVDDLAQVSVDGRPLIEHVPGDLEASCEVARHSDAERQGIEHEMAPPPEVEHFFALARSDSLAARREGQRSVNALTRSAPLSQRALLYRWWALTVRVERCAADLATRSEHELDLLRIEKSAGAVAFDFRAEVAAREELFEQESELQRYMMVLDRAERVRRELASLKRRPATDSEQAELDRARFTKAAFDELVEEHAALVRDVFTDQDPHAFLRGQHEDVVKRNEAADAVALGTSGHWRFRGGAGVWSGPTGTLPAVSIASSGLLEELGDRRVRGFHPGVQLKALDGEMTVAFGSGWPQVTSSHFTLFGVKSLVREPAWVRRAPLSDLGFGLEVLTDTRLGRAMENRSGLTAELLAIAGHDAAFSNHFVFGVGLNAFASWPGVKVEPWAVAAGPYATVAGRVRLPGHGFNGLKLEARYQLLARTGANQVWVEELSGQLGIDVALGQVLVQPRINAAVQRLQNHFEGVSVLALLLFEQAS